MTTEPRIYVACLASYNAGKLHGEWIDATDEDVIREGIARVLATSPIPGAEEHAIHDYEGFDGLKLGEYEDVETIARVASLIAEHGEVFAALLAYVGGTRYLDRAVEVMTDGYYGEWKSLEDYAENYLDDCGGLDGMPENLRCYFDYERFARDLELGGDVFTIEVGGMVHVFGGHV